MKHKAIRNAISDAQTNSAKTTVEIENAKIICFSDHHRGGRDGADDFAPCEQTYINALNYYLERDYHLILLGDVEELWENKPETIFDSYYNVLEMESKFHQKGHLSRIWGNHDDLWQFPDAINQYFASNFGKQIVTEAIEMVLLKQGKQVGKILWLHGHQGTLFSAKLASVSKFFVRLIWRPLQRLFQLPLSTARNTPQLRHKTDKAMHLWASTRSSQLIVCGHTHQYIFGSQVQNEEDKPCYYNTGACSYGNGNISGIEISNEKIRLIEWTPESSEPYHITKGNIIEILNRCK